MRARRHPRPDLSFDAADRVAMEAEAARLAAALVEAGMRPQGPGFPHVAWRRRVLPLLRRRMPRSEAPTAAAVAALLAAFARGRGEPLAYVRLPLSVALETLPDGSAPVPTKLDPGVAADLAGAAALLDAFVESAPGRVRTTRSGTAR